MGFRVVVCSTRDAEILVESRCTNRDLARWEKGVIDSLRGMGDEGDDSSGRHGGGVVQKGQSVNVHWTALLLDEAAQGIEPEVAVALSVVAPPEEASGDRPIFVMAGDQRQLVGLSYPWMEVRFLLEERSCELLMEKEPRVREQ